MAEYDSNLIPNLQENLSKITLDNITSVSLNTDALRENFEAIVTILKGLVKRVDGNQVDKDRTNQNIKDLTDRVEKLEDKQAKDKEELSEKINNNETQIQNTQKQTEQNTADIEKLKEGFGDLKNNQDNLTQAFENSNL